MEEMTMGAGLGALGFWLFIAAVVTAGIWDSIRKRDAQHETLRRAIESGQPLDEDMIDKLLSVTGNTKDLARDLRVGMWIMLSLAPGLLLFGWIMSLSLAAELLPIMGAVAALMLFLALGMLAAAKAVERSQRHNEPEL